MVASPHAVCYAHIDRDDCLEGARLKAIAERWGWQQVIKIALVLCRGVLGLFVSATLGFGLYVLSLPIVLSVWGDVNTIVMLLVLTSGIGAGVGSYVTWFDRNFRFGVHALLLGVALTCAVVGAWLGFEYGAAIDHPIWRPGIPETSVTVIGAVISANVPLFALGLYRAVKDPWL